MIKFIPESILDDISVVLEKIFIREPTMQYELNIPSIIETKSGFYEEVSDLNGIAIPAMYYDFLLKAWTNNNSSVMVDIINMNIENIGEIKNEFLKNTIEKLPKNIETISDYLYFSNICLAIQESLYFKLKQIERSEYDWLKPEILSRCKERLLNVLEEECKMERPMVEETIINVLDEDAHVYIDEVLDRHFPNKKFRFTARIDLATVKTVWELKCTTTISQDHLLQVVIYCWLWRRTHPMCRREFKIFNIKSGEILRLDTDLPILDKIMTSLLNGKYEEHVPPNDADFLHHCTFKTPT
jgi:hypothetical protein